MTVKGEYRAHSPASSDCGSIADFPRGPSTIRLKTPPSPLMRPTTPPLHLMRLPPPTPFKDEDHKCHETTNTVKSTPLKDEDHKSQETTNAAKPQNSVISIVPEVPTRATDYRIVRFYYMERLCPGQEHDLSQRRHKLFYGVYHPTIDFSEIIIPIQNILSFTSPRELERWHNTLPDSNELRAQRGKKKFSHEQAAIALAIGRPIAEMCFRAITAGTTEREHLDPADMSGSSEVNKILARDGITDNTLRSLELERPRSLTTKSFHPSQTSTGATSGRGPPAPNASAPRSWGPSSPRTPLPHLEV